MDNDDQGHQREEEDGWAVQVRLEGIEEMVRCLEQDLKERMELNYRIMHMVDKSIEERN